MRLTSRTGLLSSPKKKIIQRPKKSTPNLKPTAISAPFTVKPYAGLYNPYSHGCSLLCNHPADLEAKQMLQRAKEHWSSDARAFLFPEEVAAIRAEMERMDLTDGAHGRKPLEQHEVMVESVPEELFRRYTEMDSRPLTPAPTLASAHTRASAARRCVTPDPIHTSQVREKTLLVLDLRRSHSQETLSWYGSGQQTEPPLIKITHIGTTRTLSPPSHRKDEFKRTKLSPRLTVQQKQEQHRRPKSGGRAQDPATGKSLLELPESHSHEQSDDQGDSKDEDEGEEEGMRRRGKKRRKRGRDSSRTSVFRTTADPETLVATIDIDSANVTARPSLVPNGSTDIEALAARAKLETSRKLSCLNVDSFLEYEMLRQLRRELNGEIVDFEFDVKRRLALEEALKTVPKVRVDCDELRELQKEIVLPTLDTDLVLGLPRLFTRSSARFELPMDSRLLIGMSPLTYLQKYVWINSTRKLLYNYIFNIYRIKKESIEANEDVEKDKANGHNNGNVNVEDENIEPEERRIMGSTFSQVMPIFMGGKLSEQQFKYFEGLVHWHIDEEYDFKTFSGIGAFAERVFAKEFYRNMPDKFSDPCHEIERLDFQSLESKLKWKAVDADLVRMLYLIRDT